MSAISNLDGTGPAAPAHRTDAPVWAFHLATAWTLWAIASALYGLSVWEHRAATRHPRLVIGFGLTTVAAAILALVVLV